MRLRICLLMIIGLLAGLNQAAGQVSFAPAVNYGVGSEPESFAVADVNGDGKMDLICGNAGASPYNNGTLSILTNNGNGDFALASTLSIGHGPGSIAAADVNGDGKVDLITANWDNGDGNTLSVWTNNGSGIFGSNATYVVGSGPRTVIAADVNGDGKLDLICANFGDNGSGNTLTVLTNNGSGIFGSNATYVVGNGSYSVTAADVNEDGNMDLISANYGTNSGPNVGNGNTLTILTNNGSGIFGSNATYIVGNGPHSVIAADVNGDGKLDLISANSGDNTLTVLTNNSSGIFGSNATYVVGTFPFFITAADVNGDGKLDLISANIFGDNTFNGNLSVLTNNGSGRFALALTLSPGSYGGRSSDYPQLVAAVDVNGDGKLDLTCANGGNGSVSVLLNTTIVPLPLVVTTSLPDGTENSDYVQTLTALGGQTPYSWSVVSGELPSGLSLSTDGVISITPTTNGTFNFTVQVTDGNNNTATQALTLTISLPPPLVVTTTSLPDGTNGAAYSQILAAFGGQTPYSWSLVSGDLPSGLTLTTNGVISGTPTIDGTNNFTVQVTDDLSATATQALSLTINRNVTKIVDSKKPTIRITSPKANQKWHDAVFTLTGTAKDNVAVSSVYYSLNGSDWTQAFTADNWDTWTADLALTPGVNMVGAEAIDTSGNVANTKAILFEYVVFTPLTIVINGNGKVSPNYNGKLLQIGKTYAMHAAPGNGYEFVNWTGSLTTNSRRLSFIMASNLTFTANFAAKP